MEKGDVNDPKEFEKAVDIFSNTQGKVSRNNDEIDPILEDRINRDRREYESIDVNRQILRNLETIKSIAVFFTILTSIAIIGAIWFALTKVM